MQLSVDDALKLQSDQYEWIHVGNTLQQFGVRVPALIKNLKSYAALIIEDYGNKTFEQQAHSLLALGEWKACKALYRDASQIIVQFLKIPKLSGSWSRRSFDAERYYFETDFFLHHYGKPIAGLEFSQEELDRYKQDLNAISDYLASFSQYFVHRDYHSRNLMYKNGKIAVIDFQDARLGSPAYDLVSLCFDSYVPLLPEQRLELMHQGLEALHTLGTDVGVSASEHWRAILLQRQLKAIGSFGYLTLVKNRGNYLRYVRPALDTLAHDLVYDERWPFLSGTLLERIRRFNKTV
jgi:aminoglycoside/choline kinase family phosphotransferase